MLTSPFGSYATYPGGSPQPPPPPSAAQRSHVHFNHHHISHLSHQLNQLNLNHLAPVNFYHPQPMFYWSYPSPPVSPTHYYGPHPAQHMQPPGTPGGMHLSPPPNVQATNAATLAQPTLVPIDSYY